MSGRQTPEATIISDARDSGLARLGKRPGGGGITGSSWMLSHNKGEAIVLFEKNVLCLGADADTKTRLIPCRHQRYFYFLGCVGGLIF